MARKVKRTGRKKSNKRMSNTKLMFLSIILLFIVIEALFILKAQSSPQVPEVAGVSSEK